MVDYFDEETGEHLRRDIVPGPGAQVIPGFVGRKIRVRVTYPDGTVVEDDSNGHGKKYSADLSRLNGEEA